MSSRTVRRVLIMIDYGEGDTASGEVFDLTALVTEMLPQASYHASLSVNVQAEREYDYSVRPAVVKPKLTISFSGDAGKWVHGATHLDDVVNSALPDGDKVELIRKREARLRRKADDLNHDAMRAKLAQVAAIRHQHPIARFSEPLPAIPEAPTP